MCVWFCTYVYFTDLGKKKSFIFCTEDIPRIIMLLAALLNMSPKHGKYMNFFYLSDGPGCPLRRASGRSSSAPNFSCYPRDWYRWRSPLFFPAVIKHNDQYSFPTPRLWSISPMQFQTDMIFVF